MPAFSNLLRVSRNLASSEKVPACTTKRPLVSLLSAGFEAGFTSGLVSALAGSGLLSALGTTAATAAAATAAAPEGEAKAAADDKGGDKKDDKPQAGAAPAPAGDPDEPPPTARLLLRSMGYRDALIGGFRTMLGVPLLREGTPIGVMAMTQAVIPQFRARRSGTIVNVTSSVTLMPGEQKTLRAAKESWIDPKEKMSDR